LIVFWCNKLKTKLIIIIKYYFPLWWWVLYTLFILPAYLLLLLLHHHFFFFLLFYYYYCWVRSLPLKHGFFSKPSLSRHIELVHSDQLFMQSSMVLTGLKDQEGNPTCILSCLSIGCGQFAHAVLSLFQVDLWQLDKTFCLLIVWCLNYIK